MKNFSKKYKKRIKISAILVTLFIVSTVFLIFNSKDTHQSKSIAMAIMFDNVEDMYKSSDLVVKGEVMKDIDVIERNLTNKVVTEQLYTVKVTKVVANNTDDSITEGDELKFSRATHFTTSDNIIYNLIEEPTEKFLPGDYLLFLNEIPGEIKEFTPVSPNHVYKESSKDTYKNMITGTEVNEIGKKEMDVLNGLK